MLFHIFALTILSKLLFKKIFWSSLKESGRTSYWTVSTLLPYKTKKLMMLILPPQAWLNADVLIKRNNEKVINRSIITIVKLHTTCER